MVESIDDDWEVSGEDDPENWGEIGQLQVNNDVKVLNAS